MKSRQFNRNGSNCPICGHSFLSDIDEGARLIHISPSGMFQAAHDREYHPDYVVWKRARRKVSVILGIALGIAFDALIAYVLFSLGVQLPHGRAGAWPFVIGLLAGMPIPLLTSNKLGIRYFRKQWNKRGGVPVASIDLSTSK